MKISKKFSKNLSIMLVCIILGIMVSWQFQSITNNNKVESEENMRLEEVKDALIMEKEKNENMQNKINELQQNLEKYKNAQGNMDQYTQALTNELNEAKMIAGLVDVKGKGVIITIDKGKSDIIEKDILSILNELRASDVQAISINGERIIATSEIRKAGNYFTINGNQILPPIVIKAIADPDNIENALTMTGGVIDNLKDFIKIEIKKSDDITIPKVKDDGTVIKTDLLTPVYQ